MITRNYYYTLPKFLETKAPPVENIPIKSIGGKVFSSYANTGYSRTMEFNRINELLPYLFDAANFKDRKVAGGRCAGVLFGTGNTAPTIDDITLSGDPIDNTKISVKTTKQFNYAESYFEIGAVFTITNNGDSNITIGEIGIFNYFHTLEKQYGATYTYPYMIERTVLENPITIAPGGVGQVTYTIRTNYPV